ncbi:hypothetical protein EVAR_81468_1 [Eumeta japonica]|uniref:Uncharacterized protein n=1 Tax=Eumeta variegata TaxID=151549 RepID=A0A4C1VXZ8_EUMVA|nr:hypothetical protein EVAR_81468_1 [Eumeta japonica]
MSSTTHETLPPEISHESVAMAKNRRAEEKKEESERAEPTHYIICRHFIASRFTSTNAIRRSLISSELKGKLPSSKTTFSIIKVEALKACDDTSPIAQVSLNDVQIFMSSLYSAGERDERKAAPEAGARRSLCLFYLRLRSGRMRSISAAVVVDCITASRRDRPDLHNA